MPPMNPSHQLPLLFSRDEGSAGTGARPGRGSAWLQLPPPTQPPVAPWSQVQAVTGLWEAQAGGVRKDPHLCPPPPPAAPDPACTPPTTW